MADTIAIASGIISVGKSGATPIETLNLVPATGALTEHVKGQKVQATSTGPTALAFPAGITNAQMVYIKATDNITGDAKAVSVKINSSATLFKITEGMIFCGANPDITIVEITTLTGNATK